MAMLRGVDLHMDMANGELTIHLPNGSTIAFAARRTSAMWIIALEQHDVQQASGNMYHHAGTQPPSDTRHRPTTGKRRGRRRNG